MASTDSGETARRRPVPLVVLYTQLGAMSIRFAPVLTPENIASPTRRVAVPQSKVQLNTLVLTSFQRGSFDSLYGLKSPKLIDQQFDDSQQSDAQELLASHKLDAVSLEELGSKWTTQWSNNTNEKHRRVLFQCTCGIDHQLRKTLKRRLPYGFTGCLAHVELITEQSTGKIRRVHGYLEHGQECKDAPINRVPDLPLHPSVSEMALEQLHNGATISEIHERNREMVLGRRYRGQSDSLGGYRYLLRQYDSASIYSQYFRTQGINVKEQPHKNIHDWLDPKSPSYHPALAQAIFHYSARTERNNRLEVCIATDEMEAAWRYGHQKQILLDGTFGVCDRRLLLFIVMGVDERNHGVPLAFLLFSAPAGNQSTCGGYDTSILVKLLAQWREAVSSYRQAEFRPAVAITDTDFKERGALLNVFGDIRLLICQFHLRQCWTNHRAKLLPKSMPGASTIRDRLIALENQLVHSTDFKKAWNLVHQEIASLNQLSRTTSYAHAAAKGLSHVRYLSSYWLTRALWESWSEFGRLSAAAVIQVPLEGIIPTTNHLESFNGLLKHKHLKRWSRGGRRVRADTLVMMLATKIAPSIFLQRRLEEEERVMVRRALGGIPGAAQLLGNSLYKPIEPVVAFLQNDPRRDHEARMLLESNRVSIPVVQQTGILLTCVSLNSADAGGAPIAYRVWFGFDSIDKASAIRIHALANRYVLVGRHDVSNSTANANAAESSADTAVSRAARYVDEALRGGFLGDLDDLDDLDDSNNYSYTNTEDEGPGDSRHAEESEEDKSDEYVSSLSGHEIDEPESTSARGLSEQLIARTTYTMKKTMKLVPGIHAALDHIHHRDMEVSIHRQEYERYADALESLSSRIQGLLRCTTAPLFPPTQSQAQPSTQHNTDNIPIPASPERRQYRKQSHSFH